MPTPPKNRTGKEILERILVFGDGGSGKTHATCSIAKWHQDEGSDATFYVISNDLSFDRFLGPGSEFEDLENVVVFDVDTWPDYMDAAKKVKEEMQAHDWMSVDLIALAWGAAQDYYIERVFDEDLTDYWVTQRKATGGEGSDLDGWKDWGVINKMYRAFFNTHVLRAPGHVICQASQKALADTAHEDEQVYDLCKQLGFKPEGQKHLVLQFHTVLHFGRRRDKAFIFQTVKDRKRKEVFDKEVRDFWRSYLIPIAGWRP
jgi:hypothetical protein